MDSSNSHHLNMLKSPHFAAMALGLGLGGPQIAALQHHLSQQAAVRAPRSSLDNSSGGGAGGSRGSSPAPLEYTPETAEAKLLDYRGEKVAAFEVDSDMMICLPQAYDLFLKHLVGGLHTVYTKLKRLEITPFVCNVEQVRALRSIGAIQPGVNRCKLIACRDFDVLYEDCASSSSRPGRPPKRSPLFNGPVSNDNFATKRPKLASSLSEAAVPSASFAKISTPNQSLNQMANLVNAAQFNPTLFPFLPFQNQMLMSQLPNLLARQWPGADDVAREQKIEIEESSRRSVASDQSTDDTAVNLTKITTKGHVGHEPPGHVTNGRVSCDEDDQDHNNSDSDESHLRHSAANAANYSNPLSNQAFNFTNVFAAEGQRLPIDANQRGDGIQYSSVQNLLLSVMGLIEVAAATARKQEEELIKEKMELFKALEDERQEKARLEKMLREEQRAKIVYLKRWRHAKRQRSSEMQNEVSTSDQQKKPTQPTKNTFALINSNGVHVSSSNNEHHSPVHHHLQQFMCHQKTTITNQQESPSHCLPKPYRSPPVVKEEQNV